MKNWSSFLPSYFLWVYVTTRWGIKTKNTEAKKQKNNAQEIQKCLKEESNPFYSFSDRETKVDYPRNPEMLNTEYQISFFSTVTKKQKKIAQEIQKCENEESNSIYFLSDKETKEDRQKVRNA